MAGFAPVFELSSLDGTNGFRIDGETRGDVSGHCLASAGDVNGDGFDDLIIGARGASPHGSLSGASYVVFGKAGGFAANVELSDLDGTHGFQVSGEAASDYSGRSVSSAGDLNGDGFDDLIIGAYGADPGGDRSGASYVVFGGAGGFAAELALSDLDGANGFQISGDNTLDLSGRSVASAGDVNGDGFDDLIVGACGVDPHGSFSGTSYVVLGQAADFAANMELSELDSADGFRIDGEAALDYSGRCVASVGDVNGDGFDDLIIGARGADPHGSFSGASYVVFGRRVVADIELSALDGTNGFQISGEAAEDLSGRSVAGAGDVNGDGFDDLIIGAYGADAHGSSSGASYVVFGRASGFAANIDLAALDGTDGFQISGESAGDFSGFSVASSGDVNGDGFADIIIGALTADPNGTSSGASYVVFGKAGGFSSDIDLSALDGTNGFQISGEMSGDYCGNRVASAGDVNGDGFDDLLVGAYLADPNGAKSGASYVVFGEATASVTRAGTAASDRLFGGDFADSLEGKNGNDFLDGRGGADVMTGGDGNDTYVVDNIEDVTIEVSDGGMDLVLSSVTLVLAINVENLTLTGSSAIDGTGNSAGNVLAGTNADNTLDGLDGNDRLDGGGGRDLMSGGPGDDVFVVDNPEDIVRERSHGGKDTIEASITYTLHGYVGNLTLTGSMAIDGTGNTADNRLIGNAAGNVLDGLDGNDRLDGAGGRDLMVGGGGDDIFVVDDPGDVVREQSHGGKDAIEASITYTLRGYVGNLTLTGSSAIDGTGNTADNRLIGNAAPNTLDGGAGIDMLAGDKGDDTLIGGADADTYIFCDGDGNDIIVDFQDDIDMLDLSGVANAHSLDDLQLTDAGSDLLVDYGTGSFRIENAAMPVLDPGDFIFA